MPVGNFVPPSGASLIVRRCYFRCSLTQVSGSTDQYICAFRDAKDKFNTLDRPPGRWHLGRTPFKARPSPVSVPNRLRPRTEEKKLPQEVLRTSKPLQSSKRCEDTWLISRNTCVPRYPRPDIRANNPRELTTDGDCYSNQLCCLRTVGAEIYGYIKYCRPEKKLNPRVAVLLRGHAVKFHEL